jgi:hypothetical protein
LGRGEIAEPIEEMIMTALKMARDRMGTADLKLMNRSLKETRYAARFCRLSRIPEDLRSAQRALCRAHPSIAWRRSLRARWWPRFMVITGGGDGIMGAAQRGAGRGTALAQTSVCRSSSGRKTIHGAAKLVIQLLLYPQTKLARRRMPSRFSRAASGRWTKAVL